ncbi:MAG: tetratricopeptide repeat protein, partial [Deltaproteobacteria bacterium]|nr:tetratricopeptide repeat protein [Deltaproteobacteria bacterium]
LATILETAERGVGNRARLAVAQLPTLARCDDTDVLSADVPPPDDLGEAKVATQVREEIRQVAALRSTGKVAAGLEQAQQTLETARTIDHAPTEVVALAALGHMQEASGDNEAATETLSTAYFAAVESGQRQVAQAAARGLTFVFGVRLNDGEAGLRWGRQALAWARWIEPGGEPEADTHLALAKVYYRQGTLTESLHEGETALAQLGDAYGPDHPRVADAHLELSQVTTALGDLPRAQEHLRKALAVQTERLGSTSLFVAKTQMLLGRLAETTGDVEGSVEAYTATVDILERVYDGDHTNVAVALANLAGALQLQRRYDEALALMTRAQGIFERKVGPDHPNTGHILGAIGALNFTIGNDDEAQRLLERSIEIETAAFGPNHRNLAVSLLHLGRLHKKASRYAEAIAHFERAVAIHHSVSGPDAFPVAAPLSALGICLVEAGRPAEAIAHLEKALGLLGKDATTMGAYIEGGHALARAYESMGRPRTESRARVRDALVAARRIDSKRIDELEAWLEAHPAE